MSSNADNLLESKSDSIPTSDQNEEEEEEILFVRNKKIPVPTHSQIDTDLSQEVESPLKTNQLSTESDELPKGVQEIQEVQEIQNAQDAQDAQEVQDAQDAQEIQDAKDTQIELQNNPHDNSQDSLGDSQKSHNDSENNSNESQDPQENSQEEPQDSREGSHLQSKDTNEAEQREIMQRLIRAKRDEVFKKIQVINALHQQIANLGVPAAQDVSKLRKKIDSCLLQIKELKDEDRRVNEVIDRSTQIQNKLRQQMLSLNEKKKEAIFEFENKHLIQLKAIEEEIRHMM